MWKTQRIKINLESKHLQYVFIDLPEEVTLFSRLYDLATVTTCCDPDFIFCCGDHSRNFLIPQIKVIFLRKENLEDYVSLAFLKQWYNFSCVVMDQWAIERNLWSISCFPVFCSQKENTYGFYNGNIAAGTTERKEPTTHLYSKILYKICSFRKLFLEKP